MPHSTRSRLLTPMATTLLPRGPLGTPTRRRCLSLEPDEQGVEGLILTKDLPSEAALALKKAFRRAPPCAHAPSSPTGGRGTWLTPHGLAQPRAVLGYSHTHTSNQHRRSPQGHRAAHHDLDPVRRGGPALRARRRCGRNVSAHAPLPAPICLPCCCGRPARSVAQPSHTAQQRNPSCHSSTPCNPHAARAFIRSGGPRLAPYQPDFTRCADKFLIHAGARRWAGAAGLLVCAHSLCPQLGPSLITRYAARTTRELQAAAPACRAGI